MNAEIRDLKEIIQPIDPGEPQRWLITDKWRGELHSIVDEIAPLMIEPVEQAVRQSLGEFYNEKTHGIDHSFDVYVGMRYLAQKDGKWNPQENSKYQTLALLHDLAQFLPFNNYRTGDPYPGNKRKLHARIMAIAAVTFGKRLKLPKHDIHEVSRAIDIHDDYYKRVKHDDIPYAAQLLSDADKLFGGHFETNPEELAREVIRRNLAGLRGPTGWYLIRPELTQEERDQWQYGDRWNLDGISAVKMDIDNPVGFYTQAGQELELKRRRAFNQIIDQEYGKYYDKTIQDIDIWKNALRDKTRITMRLVAKNPAHSNTPQYAPIRENKYIKDPGELIARIINHTYKKPLALADSETKPGSQPRGWKIEVKIENTSYLIDPSVAQFKTRQNFLDALRALFPT